jgi:hypothetical protein
VRVRSDSAEDAVIRLGQGMVGLEARHMG